MVPCDTRAVKCYDDGRVISGRHNALEIVGSRAYRFSVFGCVVDSGAITSAELSNHPVEAFALPLTREAATTWGWQYFEDLGADGVADIIARLTRPTGPLV